MICLTAGWAVTVAVKASLRAARGKGGKALRDGGGLAVLLVGKVVALKLSTAGLGCKSVGGALASAGSGAENGENSHGDETHVEGCVVWMVLV